MAFFRGSGLRRSLLRLRRSVFLLAGSRSGDLGRFRSAWGLVSDSLSPPRLVDATFARGTLWLVLVIELLWWALWLVLLPVVLFSVSFSRFSFSLFSLFLSWWATLAGGLEDLGVAPDWLDFPLEGADSDALGGRLSDSELPFRSRLAFPGVAVRCRPAGLSGWLVRRVLRNCTLGRAGWTALVGL